MEGIGARLKAARLRWQLTLKEVEVRSLKLALQWGNPSYRISAAWLSQVETQDRKLSAMKLIVLAVIYGLTAEEMLALFPPAKATSSQLEQVSGPNATLLLTEGPLEEHARLWLPEKLATDPPPEDTMLLPHLGGALPKGYRRAIIGRRDCTLEPMVRAGSVLLIDTRKRTVSPRKDWMYEFDRPIYFLRSHSGYVAGFCELDKDAAWLTLVPHALSHASYSRWRYRKEVEIIGTVAAMLIRRTP